MYINLITIDLCPGQSGGGVTPSGTLTIEHNGEYNVYSYASASVDVHPSVSLSETYLSNGSYTITGEFNGGMVTVNVPSPQFVTESLSVSSNGTYTPGQGVDGYSQVVVDVPTVGWDQKSLTEGNAAIINLDNPASFVASGAFNGNQTIQTVNLPYATTVGNGAFQGCHSLSQVSLPVCSYIDGAAFQDCGSLTQVSLPVCSKIDVYALRGCNSLTQIDLPMCSYIGYSAFQWCNSLTQIDLPMCSSIGIGAFNECSSLSQVSLPMCSYIDDGAFYFCSSLSIITIGYSSVCSLYASNAFGYTPIESGTGSIYVPASLVDAYKSAEYWSYFSSQIFPISE